MSIPIPIPSGVSLFVPGLIRLVLRVEIPLLRPTTRKHPQGVMITERVMSDGPVIKYGKVATIKYTCTLPNGQKIDEGERSFRFGSYSTLFMRLLALLAPLTRPLVDWLEQVSVRFSVAGTMASRVCALALSEPSLFPKCWRTALNQRCRFPRLPRRPRAFSLILSSSI